MLENIKKNIEKKLEDHHDKKEAKIEEEKHIDIEEKINKKAQTFWDKVTIFFNKIDFLELNQEEKTEVAKKVKDQAKSDRLYWMEIFLSWIIASLGLLQNSVAVIIWAMLIAPFLRPINGIAFAVARWEKKFFISSLNVLLISSLVSIFMWFIVMNATGLYKETPEILARTSPNLIDLFIAIFSAMVALLSLWYKRLWESVAWVAMAASLMPPLWVIGMELALWNYNLAFWALMLFITNIIAIILVWVLAFWLYGFTPHSWWKQKKSFVRIFLIIFLILWISIPLFKNLLFLKDKWFIEKQVNDNLYLILNKKIDNFRVSDIKIKELTKNNIKLSLEIKIIEWVKFYDNFREYINLELSKQLWREVDVEIEITIVAKIVSKQEEEKILKQLNNKNLIELQNKEKLELEKSIKQKEYINLIKIDFENQLNKKLEEEISIKLKKEIEEKLKQEFSRLLEDRILEFKKNDIEKDN